jgi:hypothetical protein
MADSLLEQIREEYEYDSNNWAGIRAKRRRTCSLWRAIPGPKADKNARKDRPTVAPDELSQYRNAVINALMANPRGARFAPTGNGANDKGAEFYQKKWREIEYRSHASQHYLTAADNALQRSYGFVRVRTDYASPRNAQSRDLDRRLSESGHGAAGHRRAAARRRRHEALRGASLDAAERIQAEAPEGEDHRVFADWTSSYKSYIQGDKVLEMECWRIKTRARKLVLVEYGAPAPARTIAPMPQQAAQQAQVFEDELDHYRARVPNLRVVRELRSVDYPTVWMYLTNGLETLHEQEWLGKYIPIISCYGKVLYTEGDMGMERKILSMTRFGRDPWKSYCYACSQELELLGRVPKATIWSARGSWTATKTTGTK